MRSDRSLILTVEEDTAGGGRSISREGCRSLLFAQYHLYSIEGVGVLVLLFQAIHRAFIAFIKILTGVCSLRLAMDDCKRVFLEQSIIRANCA